VAVSVIATGLPLHRGSNQSAWKSNKEKTRIDSRREQYMQGRWSM
jgi:hypothetical protein